MAIGIRLASVWRCVCRFVFAVMALQLGLCVQMALPHSKRILVPINSLQSQLAVIG